MRLICPNCGAQYDVDGSMIPDAGRDVQCSNCGHGWFQHPEDGAKKESLAESARQAAAPDPAPPEPSVDPQPSAPPVEKPRLDPSVTDVLREEAEREAAARREESGGRIESQPDLGLDESDTAPEARNNGAAKARMARLRGLDEAAEAEAANAPRSDLLPDVEEINSTLRGTSDIDTPTPMPEIGVADAPKGGFRFGFYLVLLIAIIAMLLYVFAPQIAGMIPALEPTLTAYVDAVNGLRGQINGAIDGAIAWIRELSSSIGG